MDLIILASALISIFRGIWAVRRFLLPARVVVNQLHGQNKRLRLRLVSVSEAGLERRAVRVACTGTTEELAALVARLAHRAPLEEASNSSDSSSSEAVRCPTCGDGSSAPDSE